MATVAQRAPEVVTPDQGFIREIVRLGGNSLQQCFQCGTCSVVCRLTPDNGPFPRKEMLWAQWGLKDRIMKDPDLWLCHGCGDCAVACPRGAHPAAVLAALRSYAITHLAVPRFFARLFSRPQYLPLLLALPAILLLAFLGLTGATSFPQGEIVFTRFLPLSLLTIIVLVVSGFATAVSALGLRRFWRNLQEQNIVPASLAAEGQDAGVPAARNHPLRWASIAAVLGEILRHSRFQQCEANRRRYHAHLAILYGFLLLGVAHLGGAVYALLGREESEVPLYDPLKVIGNVGAALLVAGCIAVIYRRLVRKQETGKATYTDWLFIVALCAVAISGLLAQFLRYAGIAAGAYVLFLMHVGLAAALLAYLPYSKFAHLLYRTVAMIYAKERERTASEPRARSQGWLRSYKRRLKSMMRRSG